MTTLTESQQEAIHTPEKKTLVLAGPGAGKTRTLTERIGEMIKSGQAFEREIVCITFTNAAASELLKRMTDMFADSGWIEGGTVKLGYCGTLHGLMLRLLKEHGALIGFKNRVAMLDEEQQERMLRQVMSELKKSKLPMKDVRAQLAVGPEIFVGTSGRDFTDVELVASEYYHRLLTASVLDFDSLLKFGLMLLHKMKGERLSLPFTTLFWDEFQDSGDDDAAILQAFMHVGFTSAFVVGDPDQSIYGFRGGSPEHILRLATRPEFHVIRLEENFRCDQAIAESANNLIAHNSTRIAKQTLSRTGLPGKVWTFRAATETEELRQIAEDINAQPAASECAVLVPYNLLAERISKGLEGFGIQVCKKEQVERPGDWRIARSLINLLANPDNDLLAHWWLEQQRDKRFADKVKLEALTRFTSINRHFLKLPDNMAPADVPSNLARAGIKPESLELVNKAIATLPDGATMAELSFALGDDELHRKEIGQGVTVTTMHAAKGREWDTVFLPAFEDGLCPRRSKTMDLQEERRLAFVSITRARHRLVVSFSQVRKPLFGGFKPEITTLSRFAAEAKGPPDVANKPLTTGAQVPASPA